MPRITPLLALALSAAACAPTAGQPTVAGARDAPAPLPVFAVPPGVDAERPWTAAPPPCSHSLTVDSAVLFVSGAADLQLDAHETLSQLTGRLCGDKTAPLLVTGHTDDVGDDRSNLTLSRRRADSVSQWLTGHGHVHVATRSAGEHEPIAGNDTPEGRAQNRRVVITTEQP